MKFITLLKYLLFVFIFTVFFTVYTVQSTIKHEYLHQSIFKNYNIESNVTYNFMNATTNDIKNVFNIEYLPERMAWTTPAYNTTGVCNETCEMLHTELEISDNQSDNIVSSMYVLLLLYFLGKILYDSVKEDKIDEILAEEFI